MCVCVCVCVCMYVFVSYFVDVYHEKINIIFIIKLIKLSPKIEMSCFGVSDIVVTRRVIIVTKQYLSVLRFRGSLRVVLENNCKPRVEGQNTCFSSLLTHICTQFLVQNTIINCGMTIHCFSENIRLVTKRQSL